MDVRKLPTDLLTKIRRAGALAAPSGHVLSTMTRRGEEALSWLRAQWCVAV